jgi:hypothetical protein
MRPRGQHGGGTRRVRRRVAATLIAAAALLAVPASAQALTLSDLAAAPASNQGGAHSNFQINMEFGGGQVRNLTVGLPPGVIGDPNATPLCTVAQLNADNCDPNTRVGSVTANARVQILLPIVQVPVTVDGDLYNLTPQPGEPARFGIVLRPLCAVTGPLCDLLPPVIPNIVLQSGVKLRPDFGLNTVINGIPNTTITDGDTTIDSQEITLFGTAPGTGKHFMRNPTSCPGPHTTNFTAVPYSGATATGSANFSTAGCENLDFSPAFTAEIGGAGQTTNGVPTTASTAILQDTDEAGLLKAVVKVPGDLNPNATIFFGPPCGQAEFQAGTCPSNTVVGLATAASPLLSQPLIGNVALVSSGGPFPNLGLDLKGQLHLLLQGSIDISTGNTVTFGDVSPGLPDIPIARFQLTFTNPPGLIGTARDICVPPAPVFHADFTGYNGKTSSVDSSAIVDGCGLSSGTGTKAKCKKAKKKKRKHRSASEAKKKHKKKSCKKKKKRKKRR